MQVTTVLKKWFLIDFEFEGKAMEGVIAWGIVERDPSGRWSPGNYCCTSPVLKEVKEGDELFAITRNSTYQLVGAGERITMPVQSILALREGYSPDEINGAEAMREKGFTPNF
ncbi:hypothetical protein [Marinobacter qingdaonensis]|uniref:Uncharacterized protein n=1 Tax=Marinobacter qingdaonensis TaxID=3108486 RepID=A0ABU5NUR3_9GAMM|nr:hypothetical protein [Marinobacter sp. ASW11-75]MEA1079545.1 hypothetical protein [Marinobacter sp. ASW11-75]